MVWTVASQMRTGLVEADLGQLAVELVALRLARELAPVELLAQLVRRVAFWYCQKPCSRQPGMLPSHGAIMELTVPAS